jgi:hypothetical protein
MNEEKIYTYDVAFSFLQQDEGVALEIADKLGEPYSTFIYSEKQAELAGKDGEEKFNRVFGAEARIAAVLYRTGWGDASWTRIERTAIQNRALEEGYDFTVFIMLEAGTSLPPWVPKTRIWYNYHKFGAKGAAASLENRISEMGGNCRRETVGEQASRFERNLLAASRRRQFLESEAAVGPAEAEVTSLISEIDALAKQITKDSPVFRISVKLGGLSILLKVAGFLLRVEWHRPYSNSIMHSVLRTALLESEREFGIILRNSNYRTHFDNMFQFSLNESDESGWRHDSAQEGFFTSSELADDLIRKLIEKVERHHRSGLS